MYVWVDCCFSMVTKMSYHRTLIVLSKGSHLCSLWVGGSFSMVAKISIKLSCNLDRVTTVILKLSPFTSLTLCCVCLFV